LLREYAIECIVCNISVVFLGHSVLGIQFHTNSVQNFCKLQK